MWSWGDGFDLYASPADAVNGYWDSASLNPASSAFVAGGRFGVGRGLNVSNSSLFYKTSAVNDAVHHLVVAFRQPSAITGSTLGLYFQLFDNTTAQCSIVFRSDGAILLRSGGPTGTILATYTNAFTLLNTWYAFEIEVVINNTTGSFAVRRDGSTSNDFSATSLNTRPGSNSYANKVLVCNNGFIEHDIDDFFWRSDASSVAWIGDIRCYARMPASDASVQFTRSAGATNASCVDEAQQNALTDYVSDATVGHADLYNIATISSTPLSVVAVTTRGYMQKSDAGARTANVQLKSGATTVNTPTLTLTTSWQWAWRIDTVNPNGGAAWTPAAVDALQLGPTVVA